MSFFSIADPEERERVVKDYKRLKREIQKRDENRKISGQNRYRSLKETFNPVVKAQEDMAEKIVTSLKEIRPVKEEKFLMPSKKRRLSSEDEFGSLADAYRNRYMSRDDEIDTSFGIKFADGVPYIASTPIKIDHDDITIYNEVYEGTPGLWSLITEKTKGMLEGSYNASDLSAYEGILRQTNVLHKDFNPNSPHPRSSASWKWKNILGPIWEKVREESDEEKDGYGLIVKKLGRIWKAKRHSGKGFRHLRDGIYFRDGHLIYEL